MSAPAPPPAASPAPGASSSANPNAGKKAVHVKWAGKTIALGTFPSAEADEKCARAKALTRAWRSTMRPKPTREWVMMELERLGVRVVSGRLGRKAGEEDEGETPGKVTGVGAMTLADKRGSMGWGTNPDLDTLMQRRSSSLGLSMLNDDINRRSSLGSLGPALGFDGHLGDAMPPHRPLVGGGAAAAYEAARADHYAQKREEQQRRASSLGLGSMGAGGGMPQMGLSVNPNQHYEMLKLHHMNLLNEIQETTLMMNLYQQQQLQQQQQQLQQQQASEGGSDQMSMLLQQQGAGTMDGMFGAGGMGARGSLGLGMVSNSDMVMARAPPPQVTQKSSSAVSKKDKNAVMPSKGSMASKDDESAEQKEEMDAVRKKEEEQKALEDQLKKLKEEIERSKKEAEQLKKAKGNTKSDDETGSEKRKAEDSAEGDSSAKKVKAENKEATEKTDSDEE